MRIKRVLSLAICLVLVCLSLVGCENEIGWFRDQYDYEPEKIVNMDFDVYIIVGEDTHKNATTTVNNNINNALSEKFNTRININYLTLTEYNAKVSEAIAAPVEATSYISDFENTRVTAGKIVLINSAEMLDGLVDKNKLSDLSDFIYNDKYKELFGKIKTQIPEHLMDAAKTDDGKIFALPNNHVVGEYEYIVIHREGAQLLNYVDTENSELRAMNDLESCGHLVDYYYDDTANVLYYNDPDDGTFYSVSYDSSDEQVLTPVSELPESANPIVRVEKGAYEDQMTYMSTGYVCNISKVPECTREEAFASAFAVIADTEIRSYVDVDNNKQYNSDKDGESAVVADKTEVAKRAFQIVNAFNSDEDIRNLLQYGVKGINYELALDADGKAIEGKIGTFNKADGYIYNMYLKYTGDIFNAYFAENPNMPENLWTEEMYNNGINQNKKVNYYKDIYLKQ